MTGVPSTPVKSLSDTPEPQPVAPGSGSDPPFIAENDLLGDGHNRSTREVARFSTFSIELMKQAPPPEPPQATVVVPQLIQAVSGEWETRPHTISVAATLTVERASKFSGKPDLAEPSRQLAEFTQGRGTAYETMRDEDLPALIVAWANSVQPSPIDARNASRSLAYAMCRRAGVHFQTPSNLPF
jgi:hypothetical protein